MNAAGLVEDVAAGLHGDRAIGIVLRASAEPPCAFEHDEEPIGRVEVRAAHVAGQPTQLNHVRPGLRRIAEQDRLLVRASLVAHELDVRGRDEGDGVAIDVARGDRRHGEGHDSKGSSEEANETFHGASFFEVLDDLMVGLSSARIEPPGSPA
jgi:hypothetical protein